MQTYAITFRIDGEEWTEIDPQPSPDAAVAYAKVRLSVVIEERGPELGYAAVYRDPGRLKPLGLWDYVAEGGGELLWTPHND